jgi:PAS domain S-box-containing protein
MSPIAARVLRLGLPLAALVVVGGVLVELVVERSELNVLKLRQVANLEIAETEFASDMAGVASDLAVVSSHEEVVPALDPGNEGARARLAREFLAFARSKHVYFQVRLLGSDGRELVRVNFIGGRAIIVPNGELQDKSDSHYFKGAIALEPGAVYVSPIDLNMDHGVVTEPPTPVIRLATPIADGRNGRRGVVVVNYLVRHAFDSLERSVTPNAGAVVLVDEAGFFLRGRTPEEEWGDQLPGRAASRFGIVFPDAWKVVKSEERGTVRTARGLFGFRTIRPASFLERPAAGGGPWKIVSVIPASEVRAVERRPRGIVAAVGGVVLLLIGVAVFLVASRQVEAEETGQRATEALRASTQILEGVINAIPVRVFWKDRALVYLGCNAAFAHDAGFADPKDIIGKDDFQMGWRDQAELYRADDRQVIESGRSKGLIEEPQKTPEGDTITLLTSKIPLRNSKGEVSGVLGTYMDITEHKRAAEALRASEQRTRAILENMLGGLIMVDPQGLIELVNPAGERMFGYSGAELLGQPLHMLVPATPGIDVGAFLRKAAEKAMGRVTEWEGRRKNGEIFPFELALFQFETPEGRRIAGSFVDITERRGVDRLKHEFMSSISHELRTPLTSIRGSLGLLAGGALGKLPEEAVEFVAVAERNAVRLIGLINDILDLERLEGGRMEMEFEATETAPIVRRALESVQSFADQAGVVLTAEPASVRVRADGDRIVQVLVNLLSNAVKFSPAGSAVRVRVVPGASMAEFQVEDRGRGVPPTLKDAIFERYRQVEASDSRRKGGVGLGLAICKSIVEQHGGTIGVRDAEGAGSTFWFRIPLTSVARLSLSASIKGARGLALLVDDDEELLSILELRLAQDRIATQRATTARGAIAAAQALKPDVLVLDLGLPDGDGSEVVEALRRDKTLRDLPLLVYTGRDLRQEDRDRLVLGPTRYLTKSREAEDEFRSVVLELLAEGARRSA